MRKHLSTVHERHAKVHVAVVFKRELQVHDKWILKRTQDLLLVEAVRDLSAPHDSLFADDFHREKLLCCFALNEFLSEQRERNEKIQKPLS
jgi:hypothetical protein